MQNKIKWYLIVFLMIVGTSQVFGKEGVKPINVVISLVEKSQWETAKLQVQAIQKSLKDDEVGDIELVMGGDSVLLFGKNSPSSDKIRKEIAALVKLPNVRVVACSGAMRRAKISKESLIEGVEQVKNAPREIVDRQLQGYAILNQ